jgi:hypothetical protein
MTWSRNFIVDWLGERLDGRREALENCVKQRAALNIAAWLFSLLGQFIARELTRAAYGLAFALSQLVAGLVFVLTYAVDFVLDCVGFAVGLILSIPVLGGILRTVLNWGIEVVWRILSIPDFIASVAGLRVRKKLRFGIIIPVINGTPVASEAALQPWVTSVETIFRKLCNIEATFSGFHQTKIAPPGGSLVVSCSVGGFFGDWWLRGSWMEFVTKVGKFRKNWRNVVGYGGEMVAFVANSVDPGATEGCSFAAAHNYIAIEPTADQNTLAHEFGHSFLLPHANSAESNLMHESKVGLSPADITLGAFQIGMIRTSRHVSYL